MEKIVIIVGDINDGDYVTEHNVIHEDDISDIKAVVEALKKSNSDSNWEERGQNYVDDGLITSQQLNFFKQFVPSSNFDEVYVHTIENVEILTVAEREKLI